MVHRHTALDFRIHFIDGHYGRPRYFWIYRWPPIFHLHSTYISSIFHLYSTHNFYLSWRCALHPVIWLLRKIRVSRSYQCIRYKTLCLSYCMAPRIKLFFSFNLKLRNGDWKVDLIFYNNIHISINFDVSVICFIKRKVNLIGL